ncbi:MAG: TonB-dependent receptor [Acidobacteria bacterium]|nr:TonB-dependent receptor [Acidobacteriota bacterium]
MRTKILGILLVSILLPLPLFAVSNASVTGHVYDPSGRPVPDATITARETATGAINTTTSNSIGLYQFPFLPVGSYEFTVKKPGFKEFIRSGVTLSVAQRAVLDFRLELGAVTEHVQVTANASLLQTTSGENSWTISAARVAAIPIRNLNTIESTWYAPGVTVTGSVTNLRPFDTAGSQQEDIGGGMSGQGGRSGYQGQANVGNMVMVNGISVNTHAVGVGYNAIADTVEEVHVQSTMYDAEYGWTTGGVVNTITKGGTNTWHGHAYEYVQNTLFNANTFTNNAHGIPRLPWHQNYFGGSVGGPIVKNKLFFFFAYQHIKQVQPDPFIVSVPTAQEKNGNFSNVFNSDGTLQTIYNPLTTSACTTVATCTRTPFTGNIIPPGDINPVAKSVLALIPEGNVPGDPFTHLGNLVNTGANRKFIDDFPEYEGRLDYNVSDKTHMFFQYGYNSLAETRGFVYSLLGQPYNIAETSSNVPFGRQNDMFTLQVTHTFNPTTVLMVRTGLDRFYSISGSSISRGFNVGTLGFSPTFVSEAGAWFPRFNWADYNGAGSNPSGITPSDLTVTNDVILAKTYNQHNLKFGFQNMEIGENVVQPGFSAGNFSFNGIFTTANPLAQTSTSGNSIADFLLGDASSGFIQRLSAPALMEHLYSLFGQDDIHVSSRLTLNVGLRWDYLGPLSDRFNALTRGFCQTCASPLIVPGLPLTGGLEFAGVGSNPRGIYNPKYGNFGPRFGFAYRFWHDTVLRGGYGIIYGQMFGNPGAAPGFSQTTGMLTSVQTGIPFNTLTNPFPDGILLPVGNANGLATGIGQGISQIAYPNMNIPRTQQYSLSIQHQFRHNWLASASYVGSYIDRLPVSQNINFLSLTDRALGVTELTKSVPNPFLAAADVPQNAPLLSLLSGTYLTAPTVQLQQLLAPYPQFPLNGLVEQNIPIGKSKYNGVWVDLQKRMSYGLDFDANFTWSKNMQAMAFLNPTDSEPSWTISPYDVPEQFKMSALYELPYGPHRRWGSNANPLLGRLLGGWSVSAISRWQAGLPMPFPIGVAPTGNPQSTPNQSLTHWFNTCTLQLDGSTTNCQPGEKPAWVTLQPFQLTQWSPYISSLRLPGLFSMDISAAKSTQIKERFTLLYRADFINAFNHPIWNLTNIDITATSGQFGGISNITGPANNPRVIMMSLQLLF